MQTKEQIEEKLELIKKELVNIKGYDTFRLQKGWIEALNWVLSDTEDAIQKRLKKIARADST